MVDYFADLDEEQPAAPVPPRFNLAAYQEAVEQREKLPPGLLSAVAQVESSGNPNAIGPQTKYGRAKGLYQFIDSTAAEYGLTDPFDPIAASDAAGKKLAGLVRRYDGDLVKATQAYNFGEGNLARRPPPAETRNYSDKVLSLLGIGAAQAEPAPEAPAVDYFAELDTPEAPQATPAEAPAVDYFAELDTPLAQDTPDDGGSWWDDLTGAAKAFGRQAAVNTVPAAGGLAGGLVGAQSGAALGATVAPFLGSLAPVAPIAGGIVGGIAGGVGGGLLGHEFQDSALAMDAPELRDELAAQTRIDREEHPYASLAGELAPNLAVMRPSWQGVKEAGGTVRDFLTAAGRTELKALPAPELAARVSNAANVAAGGGLGLGIEGANQLAEGDIDPLRLAGAGAAGLFFNRANALGRRLGLEGPRNELEAPPIAEPTAGTGEASGTVPPGPVVPEPGAVNRPPGFEIVDTPDGQVIRPRVDTLDDLPNIDGTAPPVDEMPVPPVEGDLPPDVPPVVEPVPGDLPPDVPPVVEPVPPAPEPPPAAPTARTWQTKLADADELERLARSSENATIRAQLLGDALDLRKAAEADKAGQAPKMSRAQKMREAARIDPERDDLITAIRKLGGIDVVTESDWAGRLSHLKPSQFGLKGIEQAKGGGRTLDELAEHLEQFGYLSSRDVRELEAALSQAETGQPVYSMRKQDFGDAGEGAISSRVGIRGASDYTDQDFTFRDSTDFVETPDGISARDPEAFSRMDADYHLIGDHGELVPARELTGADLEHIEKLEQERADEEAWYERERAAFADEPNGQGPGGETGEAGGIPARPLRPEADTGPLEQRAGFQDPGAVRLPQRVGDPLEGRPDNQPEAGEAPAFDLSGEAPPAPRPAPTRPADTADLFGRDENAQGLADLQRQKDQARNGTRDVEPGEGEGDIFGAGRGQRDIGDTGPGTLHANPIAPAARLMWDTVRQHPNSALLGAFSGGVGGATVSDEKPFSPGWWRDVAMGAGLGAGAFAAGRRAGLYGRDSLPARVFDRTARAINSLPLIGSGPEEVRNLKRLQRTMRANIERETGAFGEELLRRYTPSERAMMADLIENRGIVPELGLVHRQAQELENYLSHVTERMKALKMLPEDTEVGGYLHRYYAKHLLGEEGRRARNQGRIFGSWSIERGTEGSFHQNYLSPGARAHLDQWRTASAELRTVEQSLAALERRQGRRGMNDMLGFEDEMAPLRERQQELTAELRDLERVELSEYLGQQDGAPRSFLFMADEVPRVPGLDAAGLGLRDTPPANSVDARAMPQAPMGELHATDRRWTLRGARGEEALFHRDWTRAERDSWGEIRDVGYRLVRGMQEVSHDLSLATLFDKLARNKEWVSSEPRRQPVRALGREWFSRDWVEVPKTSVKGSKLRTYGALAGKYVRPDVWDSIANYGRPAFAGGPVGDVYRQALAMWKKGKTVYNPVTHFNNTWSNSEMLLMGGYGPRDLFGGLRHMLTQSDRWREAQGAGLFGGDLTSVEGMSGELRADLERLTEQLRTQADPSDALEAVNRVMSVKERLLHNTRQAALSTKAAVKAGARAVESTYRFEDEVFKMAVYAAERDRGASRTQAVDAAERLFFDYADVPRAVKVLRDFPLGSPFITYTYKAIPAIARNIVEHPERVAALAMAYHGINYLGMIANSPDQAPDYWGTREAEEELSPEWERGRSVWGAPNVIHVPGITPEGYRLSLARAHAGGNPFMDEAGGKSLPQMPLIGSAWGPTILGGNPILSTALDLAMNEDWKGRKIWDDAAPKGEKLAKARAYLYQAAVPSNVLTPGGYQQSRILEGMANDTAKAREAGEPDGVVASVVDSANWLSEQLGMGQFTGRDRGDNEILTRDAWLASFGIKLRPERWDQGLEFAQRDDKHKRDELRTWLRKKRRDAGEGRLTSGQLESAEAYGDEQSQQMDKALDKKFDAREFLRSRGR